HIGAEAERLARVAALDRELDRQERRVVDGDAAFFHWRDQEISVPFPLEHRSEQLNQSRPPDRRLEVEPGAVRGDAHVEVAAERRVPEKKPRGALSPRPPRPPPAGGAGPARPPPPPPPLPSP